MERPTFNFVANSIYVYLDSKRKGIKQIFLKFWNSTQIFISPRMLVFSKTKNIMVWDQCILSMAILRLDLVCSDIKLKNLSTITISLSRMLQYGLVVFVWFMGGKYVPKMWFMATMIYCQMKFE